MTTLAITEQPKEHTHTLDDLLASMTPPEKEDPGLRARAALATRKAARVAKRAFIRLLAICFSVVILAIAAVSYYGYTHIQRGYLVDQRPCSIDIGGTTITGHRSYSYPYTELFGLRNINTNLIDEKTLIDVTGSPMTILGLTGDKLAITNVGMGERGTAAIKPADTYIFMVGKQIIATDYKSLCK